MSATNNDRVRLRAEVNQMHDGVLVHRGDPFSAPLQEARDLVALNFATVVDHSADEAAEVSPMEVPTTAIQTPKPQIKKKPVAPAKGSKPKKPGRYKTRDMRAE